MSGPPGSRSGCWSRSRTWSATTRAGHLAARRQRIYTVGITATAGWPTPFPDGPPTYEDCHPAAYDSPRPARYMDESRDLGPGALPQRRGIRQPDASCSMEDDELKLICVQAYNDFLRDFASVDPRRLITIMATPFWDIDATVAEVEAGRQPRPSRHPVHRRAAALRAAVPRRPALGPAVVGAQEAGLGHPLPHRKRRHGPVVHARTRRRPRVRGDLCLHARSTCS